MSKGLGINTIWMYEKMVEEEFAPIEHTVKLRNSMLEKEIEIQVKKDLGIYRLFQRKTVLEVELKEIKSEIGNWTENKGAKDQYGGYKRVNLISAEVEKRLQELDGALGEVQSVKSQLLRKIKLCGANDEIKIVFEEIGNIVKELADNVAKLPDPSKLIKAIPVKASRKKATGKNK